LIKHNESITSYLQRFWDEFLSKTKTKLILCGSIVSLMLKNVLEKGSPLYGRRTLDLFVEKFSIKEVKEFLNASEENAVKFYAVLDGIPKYLQLVEEKDFEKFLKNILDKRSFFYREGYYLMNEELKDISTFLNILRAIAEGNTKISEISNFTGIESKKIYPYLEILENLGFIKKQTPIFGERNSIYLIEDNFLDFWFRFIQKYRSYIEIDSTNKIIKNVFEEINSFIGKKFEKVCIDFVKKNFDFDVVGKQWGRIPKEKEEYEIDIVALKKNEKKILLGECKWKEKVNAKELCKELEEKSNYIEWNKRERKEEFIIFAKSFKEKIKEFNGRKVYCFELKDLFV
jgi:AAA+ ATPase superfamily predicted ATPase